MFEVLEHKVYGTVFCRDERLYDDQPMVKVSLAIPHRTKNGELRQLFVGKSALSNSGGYSRPHRIEALAVKFLPFAKAQAAEYSAKHGLEYEEVLSEAMVAMCKVAQTDVQFEFVTPSRTAIANAVTDMLRKRAKERKVKKLPPEVFYPEQSAYWKMKDVKAALSTLVASGEVSERDAMILRRQFISDKTATQQEIADELGLSNQRISQVTEGVIGKLREIL